jgi:hypothetical protein
MTIVAHHDRDDMVARHAGHIRHGDGDIAGGDRARHGGGQILLPDQTSIHEHLHHPGPARAIGQAEPLGIGGTGEMGAIPHIALVKTIGSMVIVGWPAGFWLCVASARWSIACHALSLKVGAASGVPSAMRQLLSAGSTMGAGPAAARWIQTIRPPLAASPPRRHSM